MFKFLTGFLITFYSLVSACLFIGAALSNDYAASVVVIAAIPLLVLFVFIGGNHD